MASRIEKDRQRCRSFFHVEFVRRLSHHVGANEIKMMPQSMPGEPLFTERLRLEYVDVSHAHALLAYVARNHEHVRPWMPTHQPETTISSDRSTCSRFFAAFCNRRCSAIRSMRPARARAVVRFAFDERPRCSKDRICRRRICARLSLSQRCLARRHSRFTDERALAPGVKGGNRGEVMTSARRVLRDGLRAERDGRATVA